jgi:hypothetical protein
LYGVAVLFAASGAQCTQATWPGMPAFVPASTEALTDSPTRDQRIAAVDGNSGRIHSFWTNSATITIAGFPALAGSIAAEPPWRFRLKAGKRLTGTELDLGSNDDIFWVWVRSSDPPALFYCRHDQHGLSEASRMIPVPPGWLIEALGLFRFDPLARHEGPYRRPDGHVELRSSLVTPGGPLYKQTVLDAKQGWVLEQHMFNAQSVPLASVWARGHHKDEATGVALPSHVEIRMPPTRLAIQIDVGDVVINQPVGDPVHMWSKPAYPGYADVDLARLQAPLMPPLPVAEPSRETSPPLSQKWKSLFRRPKY